MTLDRTQPPSLQHDLNITFPPSQLITHTHFTLSLFPDERLEVISLTLFFPKSVSQATPLQHSALVAMLLRGTERQTAEELAMTLESLGVRISIQSRADYYEFHLRFVRLQLEAALTLLREILFTPTFPEAELAQWLAAERERFKALLEDPEFLAQQALMPKLLGNHPYGRIITLRDFEQVSVSELRALWKSTFFENPFTVIAAGGVSTADVLRLQTAFNDYPLAVPSDKREVLSSIHSTEEFVYTPCPNSAQVAILGGLCLPPRLSPSEDFALDIAVDLLGGVFRSRLMLNLREDKGYTYEIRARVVDRRDATLIMIQTSVGKAYAEKALAEIRYELDRLPTAPPTLNELEGLRTELLASLMQQFDNTLLSSRILTDSRLPNADATAWMRAKIDTIRTISPERICHIAKEKLFFTNFVWSIAGGVPIHSSFCKHN